jgi:hypothetical protein
LHPFLKLVCNFSLFIESLLCDREEVVRGGYFVQVEFPKANKTENFYQKLKGYLQSEWFTNQTAVWNSNYKPIFKEVLTKRGYGLTFNMLPESKLFTDE